MTPSPKRIAVLLAGGVAAGALALLVTWGWLVYEGRFTERKNIGDQEAPPPSLLRGASFWRVATRPEILLALYKGADVNERDEFGAIPLHYAAEFNDDVAVLNELIAAGADIRAEDKNKRTPFMRAVEGSENPEILRVLMDQGGAPEFHRRPVLSQPVFLAHAAKHTRSEAVMKFLVDAVDVNWSSPSSGFSQGQVALMAAAVENSNPDVLRVLIASGVDVHTQIGGSVVNFALTTNPNLSVARYLFEAGAEICPSRSDSRRYRMNIRSAANLPEDRDVVAYLEEKVAPCETESVMDEMERQPFKKMVLSRYEELFSRGASYWEHATPGEMRAAVRYGVNLNASYGEPQATPLHWAAEFSDDADVLRVLLEAGADPVAKNDDGDTRYRGHVDTPLNRALMASKNPEIICILIAHGDKSGTPVMTNYEDSLLLAAAHNRSAAITKFLVDAGANMDRKVPLFPEDHPWHALSRDQAVERYGDWALANAAHENSNPDVLRVLVEAGADVNAKLYSFSVLLTAAANPNFPILRYVLEAGADPCGWLDTGTGGDERNLHFLDVIRWNDVISRDFDALHYLDNSIARCFEEGSPVWLKNFPQLSQQEGTRDVRATR